MSLSPVPLLPRPLEPMPERATVDFEGLITSRTIGALVKALASATLKFQPVVKTTANAFYNSTYATLDTMVDATRSALAEQGLVVSQFGDTRGETVEVSTLLAHTSGEFLLSTLSLPAKSTGKDGKEKFNSQTVGSAFTYARRYAYQALLNIAAEPDDDGNAASASTPVSKARPPAVNHAPASRESGVGSRESGKAESGQLPAVGGQSSVQSPEPRLPTPDSLTPTPEPASREEKAEYSATLKGYAKKVEGKFLQAWILKTTGAARLGELSKAQWETVMAVLAQADKQPVGLASLINGALSLEDRDKLAATPPVNVSKPEAAVAS